MNDVYEPNVNQAGQGGSTPYGPAMPGMGGGYDSLFQILWRGRWLFLLCLLLAGGGVYTYLQYATPMYTSTSRLLVDKPNPQSRSDAPQPVGSSLTNYLATQAGMIMSPEIVGAALRDPNMATLPTFSDPNYVKDLVKSLSAEVGKKVDIIEVKASSPYPDDAARFVNAVVRAYTRWHEANRQLTTADLLKDLNGQLQKQYGDLLLKRKEQMLFEQRHPEVLENTPGGMIAKSLEVLRNELATARLKVVERDNYYQGLQRLEKEPDAFREYVFSHQASAAVAQVASTVASGEHSERFRLQTLLQSAQFQLADVQSGTMAMTQRAAQLKMLEERTKDLTKQIADYDAEFVRQQVALAKTLAEDAHIEEQKIQELYDKEFQKVQGLGDQDSQYAFLKSECTMMEQVYNTILSQINQLDVGARLEGLKIYVLEKALPATAPSSPQIVKVIGIALVLALMMGAGLSLLRDWRDQRVRSPDEIAAILDAPILGVIPSVSRRAIKRGQKLRFAFNSRESEACRAIRTALLCGMHRDQARTILVTSPGPQEGKTLLVSNLGMALAQAGQRTLIIDADLRKPTKQRVFTTNGHGTGLVEVLTGTAGLKEAIRCADIDRLDILEGGQSTANPSELLNGPTFAAVLRELKSQYDRVVIDSPPVGVVTDAQILAAQCDVTLLVLRAEETSRILTQRARDALLAVGAQVAGAVVNDVGKRNASYSYYGGYGYYHPTHGTSGRITAREGLAAAVEPRPESPIAAGEVKGPAPASACGPLSQAAPSGLIGETVPVPIQEYEGRAARKGQPADAGPILENLTSSPQRETSVSGTKPAGPVADSRLRLANDTSTAGSGSDSPHAPEQQPRLDRGPSPANMVVADEKKNGRRASANGGTVSDNPRPEERIATGEKTKSACLVDGQNSPQTESGSPSEAVAAPVSKKRNGRKHPPAAQGTDPSANAVDIPMQPPEGDAVMTTGLPPEAGRLTRLGIAAPAPEKKRSGRKAPTGLPPAIGTQSQDEGSAPKKKNGRKAPTGLPPVLGTQSPEEGPAPKKSGNGDEGQTRAADSGLSPEAAALAAERWRRWLRGN